MTDIGTKWPRINASAGLVLVSAVASLPSFRSALIWDRGDWADIGRWIGCQWTHWSWEHFAFDAAMLFILGLFLERESKPAFWVCVLGSVLVIPAAVWGFCPDIHQYAGLSGIDSALFFALALFKIARGSGLTRTVCLAYLVGFSAKIGWEILTQTAVFVQQASFVPVPHAHIAGALVGGCAFWATFRHALHPQSQVEPQERADRSTIPRHRVGPRSSPRSAAVS